ncbi:hypothetical protein GCM10022243_64000 [Saccharothrix violaceirubra]|uniref:Site-specific recombinase XerD n=1 Tax=Saccharothrix violaceirubra TaxID=413306 RepID=A0A7W7T9Q7_9PSEU|nr:tyrosine-type recombinase/integrase [Saccharothrix violaceirubra]MBB4969115.1 site-specific recombinase XerD [Saccharothrix violaceirubra]
MKKSAAAYAYAPGEWKTLGLEWCRSLEADNKSPNTVRIYLHALRLLGEWAYDQADDEFEPTTITTSALRDYMVDLLGRTSPGNAHNNFRCLRTFFGWLVNEEEIERSPMDRMKAPQLEEKPIPIVTLDMMSALLDACKGNDFENRRDTAILRVLFDCGARKGEVTALTLDDIDLELGVIYVRGKGRRDRVIPLSPKTIQSLSRYIRSRAKQRQAALPGLWLGLTGQGILTGAGIKAMLIRRSAQAGVGHIHPHMFRHQLAHHWQLAGGNETDLMRIMGWKSREMLERYGASAAIERAHATARSLKLGDRV